MDYATKMTNAKPTWFVDHNWQVFLRPTDAPRKGVLFVGTDAGAYSPEEHKPVGTGYFKERGREHELGFHEIFIQDADTALVPTPDSKRISIDTTTVRTWDHDRDGVAVQEPHEFSNRVIVVADGKMSAWDQAIQVVEMMREAVEAEREQYESH